jgi:hypothetical protein
MEPGTLELPSRRHYRLQVNARDGFKSAVPEDPDVREKLIGRLIWLLEESIRRMKEEKLRYFPDSIQALYPELTDVLKTLGITISPMGVFVVVVPEDDELAKRFRTIAWLLLRDPAQTLTTETPLWADAWRKQQWGEVTRIDCGDAGLEELRGSSINTMRRWIDWWKAQTASRPPQESVDSESEALWKVLSDARSNLAVCSGITLGRNVPPFPDRKTVGLFVNVKSEVLAGLPDAAIADHSVFFQLAEYGEDPAALLNAPPTRRLRVCLKRHNLADRAFRSVYVWEGIAGFVKPLMEHEQTHRKTKSREQLASFIKMIDNGWIPPADFMFETPATDRPGTRIAEDAEPKASQDAKPKGTGRARSAKKLTRRQCDIILKRIAGGESVMKIHEEHYKEKWKSYHTFRRQLTTFFKVSGIKGLLRKAKEVHKDILQKPSAKRC